MDRPCERTGRCEEIFLLDKRIWSCACDVGLASSRVAIVNASAIVRVSASTLPLIAERGVSIPMYDRAKLAARIVHIGVGGFQRAHLALYTHELAANGSDWGITGVGLLPQDVAMERALRHQDYLYTLTEKGNGQPSAQVIGAITGYCLALDDDGPLCDVVAAPQTAIVSLTITEAGYAEPTAEHLAKNERTTIDRLANALHERMRRSGGPLTILSCDNLPGNGTVARQATLRAAGRTSSELAEWVDANCSFPNSMVDRITPATSDADRLWLRHDRHVDDEWPVVCEPFRQWVIEDRFVAGRPAWEEVGVLFTDRVHDWELYKLRMLNAGHSCMAYLAALAGITYVDEAMDDPSIQAYLNDLLFTEAIPTLDEIPGHPRQQYATSVLERFANRGVRDQIARLCIDGSAKFPTFLVPTVVRQLELDGPIIRGATALAGWARYLGVVAFEQQAFDASIDIARSYGAKALTDPVAFLDNEQVFPVSLRNSTRFRSAFAAAYAVISDDGPLAAASMSER